MHEVVDWINDVHASNVTVLDVQDVMGGAVGKYLVFATAHTRNHMQRIAKTVTHELKERGVVMFGSSPKIEGAHSEDWMLVDGGEVRPALKPIREP